MSYFQWVSEFEGGIVEETVKEPRNDISWGNCEVGNLTVVNDSSFWNVYIICSICKLWAAESFYGDAKDEGTNLPKPRTICPWYLIVALASSSHKLIICNIFVTPLISSPFLYNSYFLNIWFPSSDFYRARQGQT